MSWWIWRYPVEHITRAMVLTAVYANDALEMLESRTVDKRKKWRFTLTFARRHQMRSLKWIYAFPRVLYLVSRTSFFKILLRYSVFYSTHHIFLTSFFSLEKTNRGWVYFKNMKQMMLFLKLKSLHFAAANVWSCPIKTGIIMKFLLFLEFAEWHFIARLWSNPNLRSLIIK